MEKEKKKKKKRAGPLFTKIPGAKIPIKKEEPESEDYIEKSVLLNDEPLIEIPVPIKIEASVKTVKKDPVLIKKEPKVIPILRKAPPPVFKDGRWTDDDDEDEKAEEIPLFTIKPSIEIKEENSSFSEESNDSFDDYFPSAKSEDEEKKEKNKSRVVSDDDDEMEGTIPGYRKAKAVRRTGGKKPGPKGPRRLKAFDADDVEEDENGTIPGYKKAKSSSRLKYVYKDSPGGPKNVYCSVCTQYFNSTPGHKGNFTHHILDVHGVQLEGEEIQCKECNQVRKNLKAFKAHFNTHRSLPKPRQCATCGETYTEYRQWRKHQHRKRSVSQLPPEQRQFTCEFCGKTCTTIKALKIHIINIHERKGRQCRWCRKVISYDIWKEHLEMEKEKHKINTLVVCDICGAKFTSKFSAANHRRNFHRPDHPGMSCELCGKKFKYSTSLSQHKKNNHGEKKFQCAYCNYRNVYKFLITQHIRKKHKIAKEDIPEDAVIEHEQGPLKDREIKDESSKYFQKKKERLQQQMLLEQQQQLQQQQQQQQQQQHEQELQSVSASVSPAPQIIQQQQQQPFDTHVAMWAYAQQQQQRFTIIKHDHDQSSNSNY